MVPFAVARQALDVRRSLRDKVSARGNARAGATVPPRGEWIRGSAHSGTHGVAVRHCSQSSSTSPHCTSLWGLHAHGSIVRVVLTMDTIDSDKVDCGEPYLASSQKKPSLAGTSQHRITGSKWKTLAPTFSRDPACARPQPSHHASLMKWYVAYPLLSLHDPITPSNDDSCLPPQS
jgi:hypothetical protein